MSLRKTYQEALAVQTATQAAQNDDLAARLIRQTVEGINRDGDFRAYIKDLDTEGRVVLNIRNAEGRWGGMDVVLPQAAALNAYNDNSGNESAACSDLMETAMRAMAAQQAQAERARAQRAAYGLR